MSLTHCPGCSGLEFCICSDEIFTRSRTVTILYAFGFARHVAARASMLGRPHSQKGLTMNGLHIQNDDDQCVNSG